MTDRQLSHQYANVTSGVITVPMAGKCSNGAILNDLQNDQGVIICCYWIYIRLCILKCVGMFARMRDHTWKYAYTNGVYTFIMW